MASNSVWKKVSTWVTIGNLALGVVGGALGAAWKAEAKVQEVSERVVREQWANNLQAEATRIATEAAEKAAYKAVTNAMNEAVVPLSKDFLKHDAAQGEHEKAQDRRIEKLETRAGY